MMAAKARALAKKGGEEQYREALRYTYKVIDDRAREGKYLTVVNVSLSEGNLQVLADHLINQGYKVKTESYSPYNHELHISWEE